MLVRDTIANFIGGVSQQVDKLMYPNQAKSLVNYFPSPSVGLKDRPPTEYIARLMDTLTNHPLIHTIIKEDEEYGVIITGDSTEGIKVFDLDGNAKTVTYDNSSSINYITTSNPLKDLVATTIADYTFILNRTVTAQMLNETFTNPYPASALIFIKQGDYATDYKITVNGTQVASKTTSSTDRADCKTTTIAKALYDGMVTQLGTTNWNIQLQNSTILLTKKNGSDFTIQTSDSNSDCDLYCFYKEANSLNDLPLVAPNSFIMKIIGEDVNVSDDYYVQFSTADGSEFGTGAWQECCSPNIQYKFDATTMPHALIRQANGTFRFQEIDWTERKSGDEDSAPTPSFIGNTIQDIFTHKGRLAFLSADKSIYSDTQDIFSFFKKTTLTDLETDPIDVGSNSKMVSLTHSLPFNEELLLFSNTSEFSIKGGDVFSNSTVGCDLTMEYPCSKYCKPINAGGTGFFLFENGNYSRVMEIYITSTYTVNARDITEQVPSYLPNGMYKIAGSTANNIACFLSTSETDSIYVYNYYYSSEQKAQSAWSKWNFKNTKVLNVDFKENFMYLYMQYSDGIYLEKMNFSPKNKEANLDFLCYLDRKLYFENPIHSVGRTIINLPYMPDNEITILNEDGVPLDYTTTSNFPQRFDIDGEYDKVIVGNTFESTWELPKMYYREQLANGTTKVKEGILMLRDINLSYAETGYFKINIIPKYTTQISSQFEFTGMICGTDTATLGKITISNGTFLLPIISKNEEIDIVITNDSYLPSCFLSLEWLGDFNIRGQ